MINLFVFESVDDLGARKQATTGVCEYFLFYDFKTVKNSLLIVLKYA